LSFVLIDAFVILNSMMPQKLTCLEDVISNNGLLPLHRYSL